ncbi:hypothetical protein E2P42_02435 [Candidatus Bathyarchaeota archaeon]|nr:hypothetical protein E2P42_02435 [Candidatus Bathyarchaeota archaeon]
MPRDKAQALEIAFAAVFSAIILVVFYSLISMNGLVLGNDPAVHLERAQDFLRTGQIPLANLGWTPPLYQILLAILISLTGARSLEQMIFLVKTVAVVVDWLLFFSVYIIGARFFGRRVGAVAAVLLLMSFPMFEINLWGGYTSVLGMSFMVLLLLYLPSAVKSFGYLSVTFLVAFSVVLSHQLAAFLTVIILVPIILVLLIKSRGTYLKALIALILGGGTAFFLYYFQAIMPYLGGVIEHLFFLQKTTIYQVPATTLNAFMVNFGFIFLAALCGVFFTFFHLRTQRKLTLWLVLFLSFLVPFVLAESHLFGLYLPFQWFIYYLLPPLAVFAAAFLVFALDKISASYLKHQNSWGKIRPQAVALVLIVLLALVFLFRFGVVYGKINEASIYYSTSDIKGYDAGVWLRNNFPDETTAVVTEVPGFWFRVFSGKTVIAATDPIVERNVISESVLDLSYELEHPQMLVRAFEAKGDFTDETYVSINAVWNRVSYSSASGDFVSYRANGLDHNRMALGGFTRDIGFDDVSPANILVSYINNDLTITKTISFQNDSYTVNVRWSVSALKGEISNVVLYITAFLDLRFTFAKAYLSGMLDWQNPWDKPTTAYEGEWATVDFSPTTITDKFVGLYDETNEITFALKFEKVPDWGNVGALASRQIDAVRFNCSLGTLNKGSDSSFTYQFLAFSKSSNPDLNMPTDVKTLFAANAPEPFEVIRRDYQDYILDKSIQFIVYDKNQLDTKMAQSKLLQLIYSNNRYVIFKIKGSS